MSGIISSGSSVHRHQGWCHVDSLTLQPSRFELSFRAAFCPRSNILRYNSQAGSASCFGELPPGGFPSIIRFQKNNWAQLRRLLLHVATILQLPRFVGESKWAGAPENADFSLHCNLVWSHEMWQPVEWLSAVLRLILYVSGAAIGSDGRIYCAWLRNSQSLKQDLCHSQRANSCWIAAFCNILLAKFGIRKVRRMIRQASCAFHPKNAALSAACHNCFSSLCLLWEW